MAKITFILANPQRETSSVSMLLYHFGKKYKIPTGVKDLQTKFWSKTKQHTSESQLNEDGKPLNLMLTNFELATKKALLKFDADYFTPTQDQLKEAILLNLNPGNNFKNISSSLVIPYIDNLVINVSRKPNSIKSYKPTLNHLKAYEDFIKSKLTWSSFDMSFYNNYQKFCYAEKMSLNSFSNQIKYIKFFFHSAHDDKLHNFTLPNGFKKPSEESDSIYFNVEELIKLHNFTITEATFKKNPSVSDVTAYIDELNNTKDLFLIGCFTALRYSDYSNLKTLKSTDTKILKTSEKTTKKTIIPMHYIIREILERRLNQIPVVTSQLQFNRHIKIVCQLAGFTEPIEKTITKGGEKERTIYEKWELASSHTARRSGATNMLLALIPIPTIMSFTGHTSPKSFMKYVKASQEELANLAMENPFFHKPCKSKVKLHN